MLKTNTKKYINNIKSAMEIRFQDLEIKDFDDLIKRFDSEFNHDYEKNKYPNIQNRISTWLANGGGFGFIYDSEYLDFACECHKVKEIPLNKQRVVVENFNNHLAYFIIKFSNPENLIQL